MTRTLAALAVFLTAVAAWAAPDAGPGPDASPTSDAGPSDAMVADAADWPTTRIARLRDQVGRLKTLTETLDQLKADVHLPPEEVVRQLGIDLSDPKQIGALVGRTTRRQAELANLLKEQRGRLKLVEPRLRPLLQRLERYEKRQKRYPKLKIPKRVLGPGEDARQRLTMMALEVELFEAEAAMLTARKNYLTRSQPARVAAKKKLEESARLEAEAKRSVEIDRQKAMADGERADRARKDALEQLKRARTEAERKLASARARLEEISGKQARMREQLANERKALIKLRSHLNTFRGSISSKLEHLKTDWPNTAAQHDPLYDKVVEELKRLRPLALDELKTAIKGVPEPPHPGDRLPGLFKLDDSYKKHVQRRERQRARLAKEADRLVKVLGEVHDKRLEVHQSAITELNELRIKILARVSRDKRSSLMGVSRDTVSQLTREVSQLIIDGLYWAYRRLNQIDQVPKLIIDVFTVGSVLWKTLKLIFLLLLLRFVRKRWDEWAEQAVQTVGRSVSLGRWALRLAKLADVLRHSGQPLLVLIVASIIYHMFGGRAGPPELCMVYVVFFWVAAYRVQLRVVEGLARYTGMERALRAADEDVFEEPDLVEQPADPQKQDQKAEKVVPASVLLVRSVRAATRYILVVVLVLELTALAVGKGTIYGLTARFSWWAAVPFVLYFLHLWRPHVERIYKERFAGEGKESTLERLVRRSHGKIYGVVVIGAAVIVLFGNRLTTFARRYLTSRDATKRLLAFFFRRRVEKHAQESGRVVAKRQELPEEIVNEFPMGPIAEADHIERREFLDEIKEVFANWQDDQTNGSVALFGHTGVGKTTALQSIERELGATSVRGEAKTKITRPAKVVSWLAEVFGFSPRPSSEKELIKLIREDSRPVVTVDNCHNLFLRHVGGFEAWDAFVRVVNETCDNVFWVISFNAVAWEYLENIAGRTRFFRRTIRMPGWSEKEIRRLIMRRMKRAGYGVSFSDLLVAGVEGVKISAQLGRTSEGYFRLLWDFTGGNPKLASHFWLDSLVVPDGEKVVRVNLFAMPSLDELEGLSDEQVFVLTSVALHQNLTSDEAARTTNLTKDFCQFAFRYCREHAYLTREADTRRSRLSIRWQRPIQRFLKRKHLLYEV